MMKLEDILSILTGNAQAVFKEALVGVYLHGSAVMGCFKFLYSGFQVILRDENRSIEETILYPCLCAGGCRHRLCHLCGRSPGAVISMEHPDHPHSLRAVCGCGTAR